MNKFIAYLDILGFKQLVNSNSLDAVRLKLDKLISILGTTSEQYHDQLDIIRFSDSIILITKGSQSEDLDNLVQSILYIQIHAIQLQIPIKGAVSFGEILYEKEISLLIGKPLINAYTLQEEVKFIGVVIDSKCQEQLDIIQKVKKCISYDYIEVKEIPTKVGKLRYNHINYISAILKIPQFDKIHIQSQLYKLYYNADLGARQYIDNTFEVFKKDLAV